MKHKKLIIVPAIAKWLSNDLDRKLQMYSIAVIHEIFQSEPQLGVLMVVLGYTLRKHILKKRINGVYKEK